jgi:cystathionine beta-lyase|tara:strand:+ start:196 stop:1341 length:1146 start_codon:yes stop_codon:yes gene_type:complete
MKKNKGFNTICVHDGELADDTYKGAVSPIYLSTAYDYIDVEDNKYPRYFNTPNQLALSKKIASLENCEKALVFGSGMAAIFASMFSFLKSGDHVIFQSSLYGGTLNLIIKEFKKFNINYTLIESLEIKDYEREIKKNTKIIYVETPSNPLLKLVDLKLVSNLAKKHSLISIIDNTFASPINQNPSDFGIDIIVHSATKYLGGHSDILAGSIASSEVLIDKIFESSINYGGNLSEHTVWLLERSIKTLSLRVNAQNENALKISEFLNNNKNIKAVYYPGLKSHPQYELAKRQMKGFGGMLSFELNEEKKSNDFTRFLKIIKPAMSLGGVESTITSPALTSHAKISKEQRDKFGISDGLLRFSVGIEDYSDLESDLTQAFNKL